MTFSILFSLLFVLEAHRGLSDLYPENTILSFEKAAEVPAFNAIETDLQMTSDGVLVCMHDDTIDRTTDGTGKVSDYSFKKLRKFRIDGGNGIDSLQTVLNIPTFEEYLAICRKGNKIPYVELKQLSPEGIGKAVDMLHAAGFSDSSYVFTSFRLNYLLEAAKICKAKLEFMSKSYGADTLKLMSTYNGQFVIRPSSKHITKDAVEKYQAAGFEVEVYGLPSRNKKKMHEIRRWGVKGGTCNDWRDLGLYCPSDGNWSGKSIAVFGGSLSATAESDVAKQIWADRLGALVVSYGVGGAGFALNAGYSLQKQVNNAGVHDVYVLWASTNDLSKSTVGGLFDYSEKDGFDETKLKSQCAGINYCIKKIYEINPRARIVLFTSLPRFGVDYGNNPYSTEPNKNGFTLYDFVKTQKECCYIHSIPVLDQFFECGFNVYNFKNYYRKDKVHLLKEGYAYIAPMQVEFLRKFLSL